MEKICQPDGRMVLGDAENAPAAGAVGIAARQDADGAVEKAALLFRDLQRAEGKKVVLADIDKSDHSLPSLCRSVRFTRIPRWRGAWR